MSRVLVILVAAIAFALPGVYSVATSATTVPARPLTSALTGSSSSSPSSTSPSTSPSPTDTVPPVTVATGVDAHWHRTAVTVRLAATDAASSIDYTLFKVDDGAWVKGLKVIVPAPKNHANDGQHTISFSSVDTAGNTEIAKTAVVKIDTTPPRFRWRGVAPDVLHRTRPVTFSFGVSDICGSVHLAWRATDQYGSPAAKRSGLTRKTGMRELTMTPRYHNRKPFLPGLYRLRLTLTDDAGNVTVTKARVFRDYRPEKARFWYHVRGAGKRVALTFDDGGDGPWSSMLRTLKAYHSHATFFPLGPWVNARLARRTVAGGNAMGSHGWTHTAMTTQSYDQVRNEWIRSEAPWWRAAKVSPVPYCRPPYGDKNGTTLAAAGSAGFTRVIIWDVDTQDWRGAGPSTIAHLLLSHLHPGAIVCMHLKSTTAAALPMILRGMHARGYKAVSLPELFRAAGYR